MATANKMELPDLHDHQLTWVAEAEPFKCSGCHEDGFHVRYKCKSRSCSRDGPFQLHEACAKPLGSSRRHPLKRGNLLFCKSPSQPEHPCRGCGGKVSGYAYERRRRAFGCTIGRYTVLHPRCAALPTAIEPAGPLIPVRMELKRRLRSPCSKCGHVRFEGNRHTWGYVSADRGMQIHVACAYEKFREAYEAARRRPSVWSRLIAFFSGTSRAELPGNAVPELPIVNVPDEESRRQGVMRTVGAVITVTGNAIGMISALMSILAS